MELRGDISGAITFGRTQIGKPYDHQANTEARFGLDKFDCSGLVTRSLWESGMPRGWQQFGEGSASMASWCERHPEMRLPLSELGKVFGAIWVIGGTAGIGDLGHTGFDLGNGGGTLESASGLNGVRIGTLARFTGNERITHLLRAPVNYAAGTPVPVSPKKKKGKKLQFVYTTPNINQWYITDGLSARSLGNGEAQLMVDLGIIEPIRDQKGKIQPKFLPPDVLARLHVWS